MILADATYELCTLTPAQVAGLLRLDIKKVYELFRSRELRSRKIGRRWRTSLAEVHRYGNHAMGATEEVPTPTVYRTPKAAYVASRRAKQTEITKQCTRAKR